MDDPPAPDAQRPPRSGHRLPVDRAVILLGLFILATVLLLGQIHPTTTSASGASGSATATTAPAGGGAAPTTTVAPATTTTTAPKPKPTNVPVLVANASGKPGAAAAVTSELQVAGWNVQAPINATAHVATSSVYYVSGQKVAATPVAATFWPLT